MINNKLKWLVPVIYWSRKSNLFFRSIFVFFFCLFFHSALLLKSFFALGIIDICVQNGNGRVSMQSSSKLCTQWASDWVECSQWQWNHSNGYEQNHWSNRLTNIWCGNQIGIIRICLIRMHINEFIWINFLDTNWTIGGEMLRSV